MNSADCRCLALFPVFKQTKIFPCHLFGVLPNYQPSHMIQVYVWNWICGMEGELFSLIRNLKICGRKGIMWKSIPPQTIMFCSLRIMRVTFISKTGHLIFYTHKLSLKCFKGCI